MKGPEQKVAAHTVLIGVQTSPPKKYTVSVGVQTLPPRTYPVLVEVEELTVQHPEVLVECSRCFGGRQELEKLEIRSCSGPFCGDAGLNRFPPVH